MLLVPVGTLIIKWILSQTTIFKPLLWLVNIVRYGLAFLLLIAVLSLIYHFGPSIRTRFHVLTPGAVFSILAWLLLAIAFRAYVNKFGKYDQMYGTVGGVAILLLFFYIDALVLLVGAEINSEIDFVTVGIPSSPVETPAQAAAHAALDDPEKRDLAQQLRDKRRETPQAAVQQPTAG
jgi:YihY family inner membrane protein